MAYRPGHCFTTVVTAECWVYTIVLPCMMAWKVWVRGGVVSPCLCQKLSSISLILSARCATVRSVSSAHIVQLIIRHTLNASVALRRTPVSYNTVHSVSATCSRTPVSHFLLHKLPHFLSTLSVRHYSTLTSCFCRHFCSSFDTLIVWTIATELSHFST